MDVVDEVERKVARLRALSTSRGLGAIRLRRASSFAWATGGAASAINTASDGGVAELVITERDRFLVTDAIEAPRFEREDGLAGQGWSFVVGPWHVGGGDVAGLLGGLAVGADLPTAGAVDLGDDLARLRAALDPAEGARMRALGARCGAAIAAAARAIEPGMTEHAIAARLAGEAIARGVWPVVDLVATDARIRQFRHPLPTGRALERHAMLVLCGRADGLVASVTRFVHVGAVPEVLAARHRATAAVDAALIAATRPGRTLGEIFAVGQAAYAAAGFPDEWTLHHQGGLAGYEPRERLGRPGAPETVALGQAYAWNPSITGTKSEDTILVGAAGEEVVTTSPDWPSIELEVGGRTIARPAILVA